MTRLEELLNGFATVIVRYHDSQPGTTKLITETNPVQARKKSLELAVSILNDKQKPFDTRLKEIITICTKTYDGRLNFLSFVLEEILFFNNMRYRSKSLNEQELIEFKQQIIQLFSEFKILLNTIKSKSFALHISELSIPDKDRQDYQIGIKGLLNDALLGNKFCNSGILLNEEVLEPFCIDASSSENKIKNIAEWICMDYQNNFLLAELKEINSSLEQLCEQQKVTINQLEAKLTEKNAPVTAQAQVFSQPSVFFPVVQRLATISTNGLASILTNDKK